MEIKRYYLIAYREGKHKKYPRPVNQRTNMITAVVLHSTDDVLEITRTNTNFFRNQSFSLVQNQQCDVKT